MPGVHQSGDKTLQQAEKLATLPIIMRVSGFPLVPTELRFPDIVSFVPWLLPEEVLMLH